MQCQCGRTIWPSRTSPTASFPGRSSERRGGFPKDTQTTLCCQAGAPSAPRVLPGSQGRFRAGSGPAPVCLSKVATLPCPLVCSLQLTRTGGFRGPRKEEGWVNKNVLHKHALSGTEQLQYLRFLLAPSLGSDAGDSGGNSLQVPRSVSVVLAHTCVRVHAHVCACVCFL